IADLHRLKDETGKILALPNNDSKVGLKYNLLQSLLDYVNHTEKPVINAAGAPVNDNSKYMIVTRMKKYGLWMHYLNDDSLYGWIKRMMAIPILPVTKMEEAFQLIEKEKKTDGKLKQFIPQLNQMLFYYKKQWLAPSMIKMVCVYNKSKRTNN
ncbi:unnamed protein product, partial [Adineta steineri]